MRLIESFVIPRETGKAFRLARGQLVRVTQPEGSQVADFDALNADDPREMFSSSVSRSKEGTHLTTGARLWSVQPWEEVLLTITADTVTRRRSPRGAISHDLLYGRCSQKYRRARYGLDTPGCQENLEEALQTVGLGHEFVHDPFNIFMKTGLDEEGKLFFEEPDAGQGDYVELRAEKNLLIAISACPGKSSGAYPKALGIEIYADETSTPNGDQL